MTRIKVLGPNIELEIPIYVKINIYFKCLSGDNVARTIYPSDKVNGTAEQEWVKLGRG